MTCGVVRAGRPAQRCAIAPARGPARPSREPKVDRPESDARRSGRVALMPSRAVRPQGKGTEALMPASLAPRRCWHVWARGVAKPQVKHLIGVSDPHRRHVTSSPGRRRPVGDWTMTNKRSRDETSPRQARHGACRTPRMHMGHCDVLHHVFFVGRRRCVFIREPSRAVRATEPRVRA